MVSPPAFSVLMVDTSAAKGLLVFTALANPPHGKDRWVGTAQHTGKKTGVLEISWPAGWQDRPRTPGSSQRMRTALSLAPCTRPGTRWSTGRGASKLCPSVRGHPLCRHLFIPQTFSKCLWGQNSPEVHSRSPLRPPTQTSALSTTSPHLESWTGRAWLPSAHSPKQEPKQERRVVSKLPKCCSPRLRDHPATGPPPFSQHAAGH